MSIFNFNKIRSKWRMIFFMHHGITKIYNNFDRGSFEITLIENLLSSFSKKNKVNNMYAIISGIDSDTHIEKVLKSIRAIMELIECQENIDYKIIHIDTSFYVKLL